MVDELYFIIYVIPSRLKVLDTTYLSISDRLSKAKVGEIIGNLQTSIPNLGNISTVDVSFHKREAPKFHEAS